MYVDSGMGGLREDLKIRIEQLKENMSRDLLARIWGKVGEKVEALDVRAAARDPGQAPAIPVRVQLPTVRQMMPQAALVGGVILLPLLLSRFGRRR